MGARDGVRCESGNLLFSFRPFVQAFFCDECHDIIDVKHVNDTRSFSHILNRSDIPIAIIISGNGAMKNADRYNRLPGWSIADLNNSVSVVGLTAISIVHSSD